MASYSIGASPTVPCPDITPTPNFLIDFIYYDLTGNVNAHQNESAALGNLG